MLSTIISITMNEKIIYTWTYSGTRSRLILTEGELNFDKAFCRHNRERQNTKGGFISRSVSLSDGECLLSCQSKGEFS